MALWRKVSKATQLKYDSHIDISALSYSNISFEYANKKSIVMVETPDGVINPLTVRENGWKKTISGNVFGDNEIKIRAVGAKRMHRSMIDTLLDSKRRTSHRIIEINGKTIGTLKRKPATLRDLLSIKIFPLHHVLDDWDTLYYDGSTKDVQIYYKTKLFAVAKHEKGNCYRLLVSQKEHMVLCFCLALASIDGKDSSF